MFRHYSPMTRISACLFFLALIGLTLAGCGGSSGGAGAATPTLPPTPSPTTVPTQITGAPGAGQFKLTGVTMSVNPASIASQPCGASLTVTYTATFAIAANSPGGIIQFLYSSNNGRGTTPAVLLVAPGEASKTYSFTAKGTLSPDNVFPGLGSVVVSSPNSMIAAPVKPAGSCSTSAPSAFRVTSIDLTASPSLNGHQCGTSFTENYNATFHLAPNGPGGTIVFFYTTNNGRSQQNATLVVPAGQTSATYTFTWSGTLSADHVNPGPGGIVTSAPNVINSQLVAPNGACS